MKTLLSLSIALLCIQVLLSKDSTLVYISSYANPDANSIYLYRLNTLTGELTPIDATKGIYNPSYITFDAQQKHLYAVNEGDANGAVSAFSVNSNTGKLTLLNQQPSAGGPCYISVDHTNHIVFAADYNSGNIRAFPIQNDGRLGAQSSFIQHKGSSVDKSRQAGPHAHMITADPTNKFVFAIDLGLDKVLGYALESKKGTLTPNQPYTALTTKPGAGPRHLVFHPNGKYAFLIHEMGSLISALSYDSQKGSFTSLQTLSTLPSDFAGSSAAAAVRISKNGKFIYGSNRGHNSIVVFAIDQHTFKLSPVQWISTSGKTPRDFNLDASEKVLIAANQDSNNVITYLVNQQTGTLTKTNFEYKISSPTCVQSIPDTASKFYANLRGISF